MEKKITEIAKDFAKDLLGYDRGLIITFIKLLKTPEVVVLEYKERRGHFMSPFSLIAFATTGFYLAAEIFIDWQKIRQVLMASSDELGVKMFFDFAVGLLSRFIWVIPVILQFLSAAISAALTRALAISFYDHLVSGLYYVSIYLVILTLCIPTYSLASILLPQSLLPGEVREMAIFSFTVLLYNFIFQYFVKFDIFKFYPKEAKRKLKVRLTISGILAVAVLALAVIATFYVLK